MTVNTWGEVFVSHTSELADYPPGRSFVQAARDAVLKARARPVDMAYFAAREGKPAEYCEQQVQVCDVYVGLVGLRYGSLVPGRDDEVSYTDLEFRAATKARIPRLVFLLDEDVVRRRADKNRAKVQAFRDRLRNADVIVKTVRTPDAVEAAVLHALAEVKEDMRRQSATRGPAALPERVEAPWTVLSVAGYIGRRLGQVRRQLFGHRPAELDRPEHVTFKERGSLSMLILFWLAALVNSLGVVFVSVLAPPEGVLGIFLMLVLFGLPLLLFSTWAIFHPGYLIFDEHGIRLKLRLGPTELAVRWWQIRTVRVHCGTLLVALKDPIPWLLSRNKPPCYDAWAGGVKFCRLDRFIGASPSAVGDALYAYAGKTWIDRHRARSGPE